MTGLRSGRGRCGGQHAAVAHAAAGGRCGAWRAGHGPGGRLRPVLRAGHGGSGRPRLLPRARHGSAVRAGAARWPRTSRAGGPPRRHLGAGHRRGVPGRGLIRHVRRDRARRQLSTRAAARRPAVLQPRNAHHASVSFYGLRIARSGIFPSPDPPARPWAGCPYLEYPPGHGRPARRGAQDGHDGPFCMLHFAVLGAGRYPYLTSMCIGMPACPLCGRPCGGRCGGLPRCRACPGRGSGTGPR